MQLKCVIKVKEVLHLVVGDAAVDHRLLARVHNDERQLKTKLDTVVLLVKTIDIAMAVQHLLLACVYNDEMPM